MIFMIVEEGLPAAGSLVYRAAEYSFATQPRPPSSGASLTINEIELMLGAEDRQQALFVEGYCPFQSWNKAVLRPPRARRGILRGELTGPVMPGVAIAVSSKDIRWPVHVDPETGWVRLGAGKPELDPAGVAFAPGAIAVLECDQLLALWLRPERLPRL